MRIGIIGTGRMGSTLGTLWAARRHHEIFFGSRNHTKAETLAQITGSRCAGGDYNEAVAAAEVVVLATPWHATEHIVSSLSDALAGKILIDLTNPLSPQLDGIVVDGNTSGGETVQRLAPRAHVVKSFNGIPVGVLDNPKFGEHVAQVYYCTDHDDARAAAQQLITDLGFVPLSLGGLSNARYLEGLVYLWLGQVATGKLDPSNSIVNFLTRN